MLEIRDKVIGTAPPPGREEILHSLRPVETKANMRHT